MDNAMYDELNLTPISSDETYSRLRMTHKIRPSEEGQRKPDIDQSTAKGVKQTSAKEAPCSMKVSIKTFMLQHRIHTSVIHTNNNCMHPYYIN